MADTDERADGFKVLELGFEVRKEIYSPRLGFGATIRVYSEKL
jgi:hypothetical protein